MPTIPTVSTSVSSTSTTTAASSSAVKQAYDKANEAASGMPGKSSRYGVAADTDGGTGATLEYQIIKSGKVATVQCTFKYGSNDGTATLYLPEDVVKSYSSNYNSVPLPVVSSTGHATSWDLLGYATFGANSKVYVTIPTGMLKNAINKTGYANFTIISEI